MPAEQLTKEQALAKLAEALSTWPLYRQLEYAGAEGAIYVPACIRLTCQNCKLKSFWCTPESNYGDRNGFKEKEYKCNNCKQGRVTYYFFWGESTAKTWLFFKVGQYPEMEEVVSENLGNSLGTTDLKMYKNALRMRNFNFGIAAVTYLRRVVENRMNDMLEIMHEGALAHNASPELLARHAEMKKEKRFSVKIDYAGDLLPSTLCPAGKPNPMAILHELASEALHTKSDEESVEIFDACRKTFEYVFGKMRIETSDAKGFVQSMAQLVEKRTKTSKPGSVS